MPCTSVGKTFSFFNVELIGRSSRVSATTSFLSSGNSMFFQGSGHMITAEE